MSQDRPSRGLSISVAVIATVAAVWLLRTASIVFVPVAAGLFVAALVFPVLRYLQGRLPARFSWAALPLTFALVLAVVGGALWTLAEATDEVVEAAPRYEQRLTTLWEDADAMARRYSLPLPTELLKSDNVRQSVVRAAQTLARSAWEGLSLLVIVVFMVLLMLVEASEWRHKMTLRRAKGEEAIQVARIVADKVRGYLYVRTKLGIMSALAAGAWLGITGVDLVLVWMVLTLLLNYIPNIGSIIAALPPAILAMLQFGFVRGLIVLGGLTVIEQVIGNYIDPRMQGRRLELSPVIVLVSLLFWSWAWGVPGALLAAPMTVALVVIGAHIPGLAPIARLAGRSGGENLDQQE